MEKAATAAAPLLEKASDMAGKGFLKAKEVVGKLTGSSGSPQGQGVPHAEL